MDRSLEIYRANNLNINIIGIDNFRESKEEIYIHNFQGNKQFCDKITRDQKHCHSLTKDRTLCKKIAYDPTDEGFCDKIIALTGNKNFQDNNKMNKHECAGIHPSTEIRELYFKQALDELFNKRNEDFVLVTEPIHMEYFHNYFKNKKNFNIQFIWTGPTIGLSTMEWTFIELKKREREGICPKGAAENYKNGLIFVKSSLQYRPEECKLP